MKRNLAEKLNGDYGADIVNRSGNARYHGDEWGVQFESVEKAVRALVAVAIDVGRDLDDRHWHKHLAEAEDMEEQLGRVQLYPVALHLVIA